MAQTSNYETAMCDVFEMASVGGRGTFEEVSNHFVKAIEEYNERNGTSLFLGMWEV